MEGRERKTSLLSQTVTATEPFGNSHFSMQPQPQQHEAQKVVALKKAYADVILNTAKEAAARVMESERRALQFGRELESSKAESLRMLMRLKQMLDAKTAEAEMASLNQKRKIDELEAQLNEAEDVITELRAELQQVWHELEKTKDSQVQSFVVHNIKQVESFEESAKPDTVSSSPNEELERRTCCDVHNPSSMLDALDDNCCNLTKQSKLSCAASSNDYYAHDPDFTSIIMRNKEPELCKNGCTQRVRALEGKLLDEKLLTGDENNPHIDIKNGLIAKDGDVEIAKFSAPPTRSKKMEMKGNLECCRKPNQKVFSYCRSCFLSSRRKHISKKCKSDKGVCSLPSIKRCAIPKWKGKQRKCRHLRMGSSVSERSKPPFVVRKSSSISDDGKCNNVDCVAKMKPAPPLTSGEPVHGNTSVSESVGTINQPEPVVKAFEKDSGEPLYSEGCTSLNLTGPSSRIKVEVVEIPSTSTNLENAKAYEEKHGSPGRSDSGRLLKYTFQRKRKKESPGNPDEQTDSEKSPLKRRVEEKHNDVLELQISSMIDKPSSDN